MKKFDQINVIPFIDIMLVLLAIVLMTATFISQGKIKVSVPKVAKNETISQDDIVKLITINEQGSIYYNDELVQTDQLEEILSTFASSDLISLKVDAKVLFQDFISVTDLLNKYKLANVSVLTEKLTPPVN